MRGTLLGLMLLVVATPAHADGDAPTTTRESYGPWVLFLATGERLDGEILSIDEGIVHFRWKLAPDDPLRIPIARLDHAMRDGQQIEAREGPTEVVRLVGGGALFGAVRIIERGRLFLGVEQLGEVSIAVARVAAITAHDGDARVWSADTEGGEPASLTPEEWTAAWDRLASEDPNVAVEAYLQLALRGDEAVRFIADRLPTPPDDLRRIEGLIEELSSADYGARTRASWSLIQLGALARVPLKAALDRGVKGEARARLHTVLEKIATTEDGDRVSQEVVRAMRAARVLEHIGTKAAREQLLRYARNALESDSVIDARLVLWRIDYMK